MKLTFEQFRATKRACDDKTWAEIVEAGLVSYLPTLTQVACLIYADAYMIHLHEGQCFVHAWWYAPLPYSTLDEAELKLYSWYEEFV